MYNERDRLLRNINFLVVVTTVVLISYKNLHVSTLLPHSHAITRFKRQAPGLLNTLSEPGIQGISKLFGIEYGNLESKKDRQKKRKEKEDSEEDAEVETTTKPFSKSGKQKGGGASGGEGVIRTDPIRSLFLLPSPTKKSSKKTSTPGLTSTTIATRAARHRSKKKKQSVTPVKRRSQTPPPSDIILDDENLARSPIQSDLEPVRVQPVQSPRDVVAPKKLDNVYGPVDNSSVVVPYAHPQGSKYKEQQMGGGDESLPTQLKLGFSDEGGAHKNKKTKGRISILPNKLKKPISPLARQFIDGDDREDQKAEFEKNSGKSTTQTIPHVIPGKLSEHQPPNHGPIIPVAMFDKPSDTVAHQNPLPQLRNTSGLLGNNNPAKLAKPGLINAGPTERPLAITTTKVVAVTKVVKEMSDETDLDSLDALLQRSHLKPRTTSPQPQTTSSRKTSPTTKPVETSPTNVALISKSRSPREVTVDSTLSPLRLPKAIVTTTTPPLTSTPQSSVLDSLHDIGLNNSSLDDEKDVLPEHMEGFNNSDSTTGNTLENSKFDNNLSDIYTDLRDSLDSTGFRSESMEKQGTVTQQTILSKKYSHSDRHSVENDISSLENEKLLEDASQSKEVSVNSVKNPILAKRTTTQGPIASTSANDMYDNDEPVSVTVTPVENLIPIALDNLKNQRDDNVNVESTSSTITDSESALLGDKQVSVSSEGGMIDEFLEPANKLSRGVSTQATNALEGPEAQLLQLGNEEIKAVETAKRSSEEEEPAHVAEWHSSKSHPSNPEPVPKLAFRVRRDSNGDINESLDGPETASKDKII